MSLSGNVLAHFTKPVILPLNLCKLSFILCSGCIVGCKCFLFQFGWFRFIVLHF